MNYYGIKALQGLVLIALAASCKPLQPEMQAIPVSSIPLGATVYADGRLIGQTPIVAQLKKNSNHQITVHKPGFLPQNITVIRRRDENKLYTKAALQGLNQGLFSKNPQWGVSSAQYTLESEDKTGECSTLEPSVVSVQLIAESGLTQKQK
ncbi:MAG: hypothetical protein JWO53_1194 [Chlamydiia bacterium]|nr:hypothetical protein [Chlamydiia bacterium]